MCSRALSLVLLALVAAATSIALAVGTAGAQEQSAAPAEAGPEADLVSAYGALAPGGPAADSPTAGDLIALGVTPSGDGYWTAGMNGGVFTYGDAEFHGSAAGWELNAPIVDLEPAGPGYWLASADGGVFSFGQPAFHGSAVELQLAAPVVAMTARADASGYWLAATDGGVFGFGAAEFHGSAVGVDLAGVVVDIAATPDGAGYWLVTSAGEVMAFGNAEYLGGLTEFGVDDVVGIAADPAGGYHIARATGAVLSFGADSQGFEPVEPARLVDLDAHPVQGYLTLARPAVEEPEPEPVPAVDPNHPFLVCTRAHESDSAGGYQAVNPSGKYRGAYQFSRATWDSTARHAGRGDLVGVDPAAAAPADQDFLALHLYRWQGASPWLGRCAGL